MSLPDAHTGAVTVPDNGRVDCGRPGRPLLVVIQNLAGHRLDDHVCRGERLHSVAADAVARFVARGELAEGHFVLTLPRLAEGADLDPAATVGEAGIVAGDVLVLVNVAPQVDGAGRAAR